MWLLLLDDIRSLKPDVSVPAHLATAAIPARWKGKQMTVSVPPSGSNKDAMLDKTTPLRVPVCSAAPTA